VQHSIGRTEGSDRRWAIDQTRSFFSRDGWAHHVGVIDCCHRELLGWEFALRDQAGIRQRL
jgi:transposase InsO family protein